MKLSSAMASAVFALAGTVAAQSIAAINGNKYLSPYAGMAVTNVTGLVTGVASNGFFMRSQEPDQSPATSESIFVFSSSVAKTVAKGSVVSLDGMVTEYRSSRDYLYMTEISSPTNVQNVSTGNMVAPVLLGQTTTGIIGTKNLSPPTRNFTYLDNMNVFGTPNNQSLVSEVNPTLQPRMYGLDFWESLSGEYVTVHSPVVLDIPNSFGDTWVAGNWTKTGLNDRGGITISPGDGNPEAILIQSPLDGTSMPLDTKLGQTLDDITGVIIYAFGSYSIRPDTKVSVVSSMSPALPPPTTLVQQRGCFGLTFADFNVDNLDPSDTARISKIGDQIANYLRSPSLLFLQEIQDNSGATNNGITAANETLTDLTDAIVAAGGTQYSFAQISPQDDTTGGQPGGNIRNGYLYDAKLIQLVDANPGGPRQATMVRKGADGQPRITFNPGLVAPNNDAYDNTRRPLAAQWQFVATPAHQFFTVNTHSTSKGGSTSLFGDARPPVNNGIEERDAEAKVAGAFIKNILRVSPTAKVIASGDWNEFQFVQPQTDFESASGLTDLDAAAGTPAAALYSYLFVQNCQALIHYYVSPRIAQRNVALERVHLNTWVTFDDQTSDHDPSVGRVNVCP